MRLKILSGIVIFALILTVSTTGCMIQQASNGLSITATRLPDNYQAAALPTPSANDKYVVFNLTVKNINENNGYVDAYAFQLRDAGSNVYGRIWFLGGIGNAKQFDSVSNTQPGDIVSGIMAFQVPQAAKLSTLTYTDSNNKITINLNTDAGTSTTLSGQSTPNASGQPTSPPSGFPSLNPSATPSPTFSPTPTPSSSPTPSASPNPTATPTPEKIATAVSGDASFYSNPIITRNSPVSWGFAVTAQGNLLCGGTVSASIGSQSVPVTGGGTSGCFETAYVTLSSAQTNALTPGTYTLTVLYTGDSTHQPSELTAPITVT